MEDWDEDKEVKKSNPLELYSCAISKYIMRNKISQRVDYGNANSILGRFNLIFN